MLRPRVLPQWCGHCKRLAPEFAAAAAEVPSVRWANVDATEASGVKGQFGITSYPRIMWGSGSNMQVYSGQRTKQHLAAFASRVSGPEVVEGVGVDALVASPGDVAFAYVGQAQGKLWEAFAAVAKANQGSFSFGRLEAVDGVAIVPSVVRLEAEEPVQVFGGEPTQSGLGSWVQDNRFASLTHLGPGVFFDIAHKGGRMLVIGIVDPANKGQEYLVDGLRQLARPDSEVSRAHPTAFRYGILDGPKWADYVAKFNISPGDLPRVLVLDAPSGVYFDDASVNEVDEITTWLQEVARGEVPKNREGMLHYPTLLWNAFVVPYWPLSGVAIAAGGLSLLALLFFLVSSMCDSDIADGPPSSKGTSSKKKQQ